MNLEEWQAQIWGCPNMNPTAVAICLAIGSHGNWSKTQNVWPSRQRISAMTGASRDNVSKYMTALEEQGWLKVVSVKKDNVRVYELSKPQVVVVHGILAVRQNGNTHKLKNQVVVSDDKQVVVGHDKGLSWEAEQVVVGHDSNLPDNLQSNLPEELTIEETVPAQPVPLEDDGLFEGMEDLESLPTSPNSTEPPESSIVTSAGATVTATTNSPNDEGTSILSNSADAPLDSDNPFKEEDFLEALYSHVRVRERPFKPEVTRDAKKYYMDPEWFPNITTVSRREIAAINQAESDNTEEWDW